MLTCISMCASICVNLRHLKWFRFLVSGAAKGQANRGRRMYEPIPYMRTFVYGLCQEAILNIPTIFVQLRCMYGIWGRHLRYEWSDIRDIVCPYQALPSYADKHYTQYVSAALQIFCDQLPCIVVLPACFCLIGHMWLLLVHAPWH